MAREKKDYGKLFIRLAAPDENGISRWVDVNEFTGEYKDLVLGNGGSWCRDNVVRVGKRKYKVEKNKSLRPGNSIDAIRTIGFLAYETFKQNIRKDIKDYYKQQRCVMLGVKGFSENTKIEIDHKDGRKDDWRVSNPETQRFDDFQPLCKAANDAKRQICKECKLTNKRWNAQFIKGNPYPFYEGDENYSEELGCVGCYQYDPVEYRKACVRRISSEAAKHTADYIMTKFYPEDK
ncbi:MAG: hypothetical protein IKX28_06720 [Bacteroidales bacterium]|nr:hypothetical protein [Bacteroidales bacterium]